jgi:hypothetical protein
MLSCNIEKIGWLSKIKGNAKLVKHQLEKHMEYDGMNEDELNPSGKHQ